MVYRRVGERYQDACIRLDRDVRLAVGGSVMVWVASQPMAGHPWSLLMAIWMHIATWRRLLDRTCCSSSVVREGTWPFSRTMLDHTLRVSLISQTWICVGDGLALDVPRFVANRARVGRNDKPLLNDKRPNQLVTLQGLGEALQEVWQEIPQAFHANLVASMRRRCQECQCARWSHTLLTVWTVVCPHCVVTS